MNEQELEKLKLLLESSRERLDKHAEALTQEPAYVAAILRDQRPKEGEDSLNETPRKIA